MVLLNSDAFLCPGSLRAAVNNTNLHPEVAVAGGQLVGRVFSWQPFARMFPSILVLTGLASIPKSRFFGHFDRTWADQVRIGPDKYRFRVQSSAPRCRKKRLTFAAASGGLATRSGIGPIS